MKLSEKIGYKSGIANSSSTLGAIYSEIGDLEKAEENYLKALKITRELGDKKAVAMSIGNLGTVYDSAGKYDKALECHLEAVKIFEELNDKYGLSHSYSNLGIWGQARCCHFFINNLDIILLKKKTGDIIINP